MYKITEIQNISRPLCKRYVVHIDINCNFSKEEIKKSISQATKEIQSMYDTVHVVRLYVHMDNKLICQSMWTADVKDIPLPLPLKYNDSIDDIGIVWSDCYVNKI